MKNGLQHKHQRNKKKDFKSKHLEKRYAPQMEWSTKFLIYRLSFSLIIFWIILNSVNITQSEWSIEIN